MRNIEPRKELMYASAILCVSIILLWLYKIPVLGITYFWDEGWSYGVAIYKMSERIPSLLPASLPPELSRGHPLMYYFINALVAKTFGFSPSVMHLFSLLIATVFLIVFFLMLLRFTNPTFALLGSLLIMTQEAFIAQSSLMLPEIFISLLVMTTIYFLITDHILWYIISATMLVLTKESGLVVVASASLIYFSHLIRQYLIKHHTFSKLIKGSLLLFLPIITGLTFYAIQKATFGWFLFPLHVQMASFSQEAITNHLMVIWQFVFWGYGRKNLFVMLVIMCFLVLLSALYQRKKFNNTIWKLTAMLLIVFSCYTLFSAINYISLRYLMPLIVLFIFLLTVWGYQLSKVGYRLIGFLMLVSIGLALFHDFTDEPTWIDDVSINYADNIIVQQSAINFMENSAPKSETICTNYTLYFLLTHPELSALQGPAFSNVFRDTLIDDADFYIFCNYPLVESYYDAVKSNDEFHSINKIEKGNAWCEIFARK